MPFLAGSRSSAGQPPHSYRLEDVTITLERKPCSGSCPEYRVTLYGDGRVRYLGTSGFLDKGLREDGVDRDAFVDLLDDIYGAGFFDMKDFYVYGRGIVVDDTGTVSEDAEYVTDLPTQIVTVAIGSYRKSVTDYWNPPADLRELEEKIDEAAGTSQWVDGLP